MMSCRPTPSWCASTPAARLRGRELRDAARALLRRAICDRRPREPVRALRRAARARPAARCWRAIASDYHAYAFATVRMAGSAFEVAARTPSGCSASAAARAAEPLREIVEGCKVLSFRLARRRAFDPAERSTALAAAWDEAMGGSMTRRLTPGRSRRSRSPSVDGHELRELRGLAGGPPRRPARRRRRLDALELDPGTRARHGRGRAAATPGVWQPASATTSTRGLVVSHELRRRAGRRRRRGALPPRTGSRPSPRSI